MNALLIRYPKHYYFLAIVVLCTKHSSVKQVRNLCKYLPATFIGYTGQEDHFKVISIFDRFINTNIYFLRKRSLTRLLIINGVEIQRIHRIYRYLENIQRTNQKIAFSQVNFNDDVVLLSEELEFIEKLVDITTIPTKRAAEKLVNWLTLNDSRR